MPPLRDIVADALAWLVRVPAFAGLVFGTKQRPDALHIPCLFSVKHIEGECVASPVSKDIWFPAAVSRAVVGNPEKNQGYADQ